MSYPKEWSVLHGMNAISDEPFYHATGELHQDLRDKLEAEWPDIDTIVHGREGDNVLLQLSAAESLMDTNLAPTWRSFIEYHTSQAFLYELVGWCGTAMRTVNPGLGALPLIGGVRFLDRTPIQMESQFCVDTPVDKNPVVKPMHLDSPTEFYKFLIRFPGGGYDTTGDLEIGTWKKGPVKTYDKQFVKKKDHNVIATIPNAGIIFFLNSIDALHGVTPRKPTGLYRRYFNVVGETSQHTYDMGLVT